MTDPAALQPFISRPKQSPPHKPKGGKPEHVDTSKWHTCDACDVPHPCQFTNIFINDKGDRLYQAQDAGWAHYFWAALKADSLVEALAHVPIDTWAASRVPYENESVICRMLEKNDAAIDYLIIREDLPFGEMASWFFINQQHQQLLNRIPEGMGFEEWQELGRADMRSELRQLLDYRRHHKRKMGRWSAPSTFALTLKAAATASIIEKAKNGCHPACEGIGGSIDFLTRLAAFLKADKCILQYPDWGIKLEAVKRTNRLDANVIDDLKKKVMELEAEARQWKYRHSYPGLPCDYAERDKGEGLEVIDQYQLWSLSRRKSPYQPSAWDTEMPILDRASIRCPSHWATETE